MSGGGHMHRLRLRGEAEPQRRLGQSLHAAWPCEQRARLATSQGQPPRHLKPNRTPTHNHNAHDVPFLERSSWSAL